MYFAFHLQLSLCQVKMLRVLRIQLAPFLRELGQGLLSV